jgi:hypothetical protein
MTAITRREPAKPNLAHNHTPDNNAHTCTRTHPGPADHDVVHTGHRRYQGVHLASAGHCDAGAACVSVHMEVCMNVCVCVCVCVRVCAFVCSCVCISERCSSLSTCIFLNK